jgi:hypothetical protein
MRDATTFEGVLWAALIALTVAGFGFAAAGLVEIVALIATAGFLLICTITLLWTVARDVSEPTDS